MSLTAFCPLATYPEATREDFAAQAAGLAATLGAKLHVSAFLADIPAVSNALSRLMLDVPRMIQQAEAASRSHADALLAAFAEAAGASGVELTTDTPSCQPAIAGDTAAIAARYHDLSIVGAGNEAMRDMAETVIFGAGRPVVLLPEGWEPASIDAVAIAWDGSRVAARAVADAQPFLARAKRIVVVTVLDEKPLHDRDAAARLTASLRAQGLPAEELTISAEDAPIAETLQHRAKEAGCGLLVMGGYGHSRLRGFVLGGGTRGVLAEARMPIMLSH